MMGFEWFSDFLPTIQNKWATGFWIAALSDLCIASCREDACCAVQNRSLLAALSISLLLHGVGLVAGLPLGVVGEGQQGGRAVLLVRLADVNQGLSVDNGVAAGKAHVVSDTHRKGGRKEVVARGAEAPRQIPEVRESETVDASPMAESPTFLPVEAISVRPYPLTLLEGIGPPEVEVGDMYGRMVLKIWIDEGGSVVDTTVLYSDMPESLQKAGGDAFRRMRFMPGYLAGRPVGSVMTVEISAEDLALPVQ